MTPGTEAKIMGNASMTDGSEWVKIGLEILFGAISAVAWTGATAWGIIKFLLGRIDKAEARAIKFASDGEGRAVDAVKALAASHKEQWQRIENASIDRDVALNEAHVTLLKQIHAQAEDHILGFLRKEDGTLIESRLGEQVRALGEALNKRFDDLREDLKGHKRS